MNEERQPMSLPSVEAWRGEFMQAAATYSETERKPRWWHRWLTPFLVVLALGTAGAATAGLIEFIGTDPELPPFKGESHGFVNLETGEPIRCPDGSLLVEVPERVPIREPYDDGIDYDGDPRCPDGSQPEIFREQRERLLRDLNRGEAGQPADENPLRFEYALPADGSEDPPTDPDEFIGP